MEDSFDFVPPTSVLAPAIMAVAAVNVIIVAYVIKAFRCLSWFVFFICKDKISLAHSYCLVLQGRECKREEQDWLRWLKISLLWKTMNLWFCDLLYFVGRVLMLFQHWYLCIFLRVCDQMKCIADLMRNVWVNMRKVAKQDLVHRVIEAVPGKRIFGLYRLGLWPSSNLEYNCALFRFLPFFFALGAALEFSMINWTVRIRC